MRMIHKFWGWVKENKYFVIAEVAFLIIAASEGKAYWLAGILFVLFAFLKYMDEVNPRKY